MTDRLNDMTYRDLQTRAKAVGIPANGGRAFLLSSLRKNGQPPRSTDGGKPKAGKVKAKPAPISATTLVLDSLSKRKARAGVVMSLCAASISGGSSNPLTFAEGGKAAITEEHCENLLSVKKSTADRMTGRKTRSAFIKYASRKSTVESRKALRSALRKV